MRLSGFLFLFLLLPLKLAAQRNTFADIDSILDANAVLLCNKVVVMIRNNGELVYYRSIGIDSASTGEIASTTKTLSATPDIICDSMLSLLPKKKAGNTPADGVQAGFMDSLLLFIAS